MLLPPLDPDSLTLFVFGPGTGESIVLFAPPDGWLVVDGCTSGERNYPLELLRHYQARPTAILLSHPHKDHVSGLSELIETYTDAADPSWPRLAMVPAPDTRGAGDLWDPVAALTGGTAEQAVATMLDRWEQRPESKWALTLGSTIPVGDAKVRVLSPVDHERDAALAAWLGRRHHDYNRAASALLVTWGGRRILLGSDLVERPGEGWTSALGQDRALPSHDVYKLAHHGAVKAIGPQVNAPSAAMLRTWIATPFARQGLPRHRDGEALEKLLAIEEKVVLTGLPQPHVRQALVSRDVQRNQIAGLLSSSTIGPPVAFPDCFVRVVVPMPGKGTIGVHPGPGAVTVKR